MESRRLNSRAAMTAFVALVLTLVPPAGATVPGTNGRIVWGRFNPDIGDDDIYTANPDGTGEVKVAGPSECPRWSPDGNHIVLPGTIIDWDGSNSFQFWPGTTQLYGCGIWSADGSRIAFESWDETNTNFVPGIFSVRSTDGGDLKRLTANPFGSHDIPGDYSPDGTKLVFLRGYSLTRKSLGALFVSNADGTNPRQITPWGLGPGDFAPRWSPDGSRIVFVSNGSLFSLNPDGSGLRKVFQDTGGNIDLAPTWSPDGTTILFVRLILGSGKFVQAGLYTIRPNGTGLTPVIGAHTSGPVKHPDWGSHP